MLNRVKFDRTWDIALCGLFWKLPQILTSSWIFCMQYMGLIRVVWEKLKVTRYKCLIYTFPLIFIILSDSPKSNISPQLPLNYFSHHVVLSLTFLLCQLAAFTNCLDNRFILIAAITNLSLLFQMYYSSSWIVALT